ncbi:MAG: hypothetical protein Q8O67_28245 [Deltaproteobacteria bacterium]|nr:hypothetical protein [Deltaproteobacteria bacterium]
MSAKSVALSVAVVVVVTLAAGCSTRAGGGGGGVVDVDQFPSRDDVLAIAARPRPTPAERKQSSVDAWTFIGPFEDTFADVAVVAANDVEAPVVGLVGAARISRAGRCVARELARFIAQQGSPPEARWRHYLHGRCGSLATDGGMAWWTLPGSETLDDKAVIAHVAPDIVEAVRGFSGDLGAGFARAGDKSVYVVVELSPGARLQPLTMKANAKGEAVVRGVLVDTADAESIWAAVNRGATGFADCERDVNFTLPAFGFRCPVDVTDAVAGIALSVQRRGRFLGSSVGEVSVLPGAAPSLSWAATLWGDKTPLPVDDAGLALAVLERTNAIRSSAGLDPLLPAVAQSKTSALLAPHYFEGRENAGLVDRIALGLLAGWDLTSKVRDGDFSSLIVGGGTLDEVLGAALDSPGSRSTLLDKDASIAALGASPTNGGIGLLLTTWKPYVARPAPQVQEVVLKALERARAKRGHPGIGEVGMETQVAEGSARLGSGEDGGVVADWLLHQSVNVMRRSFTAWNLETTDPEHIAWPEQLLTASPTYVAVASATRQRKGSPWATTVIVLVGFVDVAHVAVR